MRRRVHDALTALRRSMAEEEAQIELGEMQALARKNSLARASDSLLSRRYVIPFVLACSIMSCNQTTGINSILGFLVIILRHSAG